MSEVIRLYKYQALLSSRRALSRAEFIALLEVSPATFKRDLAKLRDQLGIPIEYDRNAGGFHQYQDGLRPIFATLLAAHHCYPIFQIIPKHSPNQQPFAPTRVELFFLLNYPRRGIKKNGAF